ncbi:MAG: AmmeMemoRadiSam system protein B [Planctomycetaceae bacterium]|nr:AmmeMemoRadiSam system protein B [Planctomycetaceae bacterium]
MNKTMNTAPVFSEAQKEAILNSAGKKVALTIARYEHTIEKEDLAGAGETPVYGVFVSLKRFRQLRACCGFMGESVRLAHALDQAAHRAAVDDIRFPVIENHEINEMEMEVWVLFSPELIGAEGEARKDFVEIGKHGLLVVQGEHRGLLLPSVATEMKLTPETFLEQTCLKAHLPKDAWKNEKALVFRFQGMVFSKALKDTVPEELAPQVLVAPKGPSRGDMARLADHCYRNIGKQYENMIPDPYLPGAFDGNVNGACLRVRLSTISADCAQIYLNRPQPLQSTLLGLSQNAAMAMRQHNLKPAELQKTALCVFWDAQPLGNVEKADLSSIDTRHSGILAIRFGKWILGYAPGKKAELILEDVLKNSKFESDEATQIFSVRVACTDIAFMTSTVQKPMVRSTPRPAAVAGLFYPAQSDVMERMRDGFFSPDGVEKQDFAGALVPHAGWKYSGNLTARTLEQMRLASRILVFAPKHHALGVDWGVCPAPRWNLPGRPMEGDENMSRALAEAVPRFQLDSLAHDREHSIEVILPFLSKLAPGSHVIGAVMQGGDRYLAESAKQLAEWIASLPQRPSLIASSDMNHYASLEDTLRIDQPVIEAMRALDPEEMLKIVRENKVSMCGVLPCAFMMMTLRELGLLNRCVTVGHTTSADAGGETKSVVGYCGMLFC